MAVASLTMIGYGVTPGDNGTKPLITTATNSVTLLNTGSSNSGAHIFINLSLSNTAAVRASGIWQLSAHGTAQTWAFAGCIFDGFSVPIDNSNGTPDDVAFIHLINCEVKNSGSISIKLGNTAIRNLKVYGCYFHSNVNDLDSSSSGQGTIWLAHSIFAGATGGTISLNLSDPIVTIDHCTFASNAPSQVLSLSSTSGFTSITNCIFMETQAQLSQAK